MSQPPSLHPSSPVCDTDCSTTFVDPKRWCGGFFSVRRRRFHFPSIKFVGFVYFHRWQRRRRMNVRPKGQIANVDKSVPPSRPFLENASCGARGKCLCDVFETRPIIFFASISFSTMGKAKFILPTETHIVCLSVCFSCFSIFVLQTMYLYYSSSFFYCRNCGLILCYLFSGSRHVIWVKKFNRFSMKNY